MRSQSTIRDIAKSCGVAPSTVSRVLNNRAGEVGEETRLRILDTMRRMNYRPQQTQHLAPANKTRTLGVISGFPSAAYSRDGYFRSLVDSLLAVISERRQNGLIFASHIFHEDPQQSIRTYCDGRCDGLMVISSGPGSMLVSSLMERGFPLVLLGTSGADTPAAYCDIDNIHATGLAMDEFLGMGHRRIALCQGPESLEPSERRRTAYLQSMEAASLPVDEELISPRSADQTEIADWTRWVMTVLAPERRPTAILCFNDTHAGYVLAALKEIHLRVPEDVSLIGFDDTTSAHSDPPVTTISQPYHEIGVCAVEAVLAQITGEEGVPQHMLLQGRLIRRRSVASPPN